MALEGICMFERAILVEDNADDEELTIRASKSNDVTNKLAVARVGVEVDFLFGTGAYARRNTWMLPGLVLVDLKLSKIGGPRVLLRIRGDEWARRKRVTVLTSSNEEQDVIRSYNLGANSYIRKPVGFNQFTEAVRQLGLYWLVLNEVSP
jgi:two-component system response regulator